jgi:AcrR family transcriptional regulator
VTTRTVLTAADEQHDDKENQYDEGDQPGHLHPARCTRRRLAVRPHAVLLCHWRTRVYETECRCQVNMSRILGEMPKLWSETIATHRREVRDATLDTAAALVAEHGLRSVTMSQIAEETGIGRATLYKYFSSVETILVAWHERQISSHLEYLFRVRDQAGEAGERLEAVIEAYALISHAYHGSELAALLHRAEHVARAQRQLNDLIRDLLMEAAKTGDVREDVAPGELATYCLHALSAAGGASSKAAVRRLVAVTLAGLRPRA